MKALFFSLALIAGSARAHTHDFDGGSVWVHADDGGLGNVLATRVQALGQKNDPGDGLGALECMNADMASNPCLVHKSRGMEIFSTWNDGVADSTGAFVFSERAQASDGGVGSTGHLLRFLVAENDRYQIERNGSANMCIGASGCVLTMGGASPTLYSPSSNLLLEGGASTYSVIPYAPNCSGTDVCFGFAVGGDATMKFSVHADGALRSESTRTRVTATLSSGVAVVSVATGSSCVCGNPSGGTAPAWAVDGTSLTIVGSGSDTIKCLCF